jgi:hypothetical protein
MTYDFGVRKAHRALPVDHLMVGLLGLLLLVGGAGWCWEQQLGAIRTAQAWTIEGPPCPVVRGTAQFGYAPKVMDTFQFVGTRFSRVYGYVKCLAISDHGGTGWGQVPVCRFNSPMLLDVTAPGGHATYFTQMSPATVTIVQGRPSCVLGAGPGIQ